MQKQEKYKPIWKNLNKNIHVNPEKQSQDFHLSVLGKKHNLSLRANELGKESHLSFWFANEEHKEAKKGKHITFQYCLSTFEQECWKAQISNWITCVLYYFRVSKQNFRYASAQSEMMGNRIPWLLCAGHIREPKEWVTLKCHRDTIVSWMQTQPNNSKDPLGKWPICICSPQLKKHPLDPVTWGWIKIFRAANLVLGEAYIKE